MSAEAFHGRIGQGPNIRPLRVARAAIWDAFGWKASKAGDDVRRLEDQAQQTGVLSGNL